MTLPQPLAAEKKIESQKEQTTLLPVLETDSSINYPAHNFFLPAPPRRFPYIEFLILFLIFSRQTRQNASRSSYRSSRQAVERQVDNAQLVNRCNFKGWELPIHDHRSSKSNRLSSSRTSTQQPLRARNPHLSSRPCHSLPLQDCACVRFDKADLCKPNYGSCHEGKRSVPIELLDVAGLVPGAHEGRGLGNRFLDDLRHADALVHVVDVSGTTDAEGKVTRGYDPSQDIIWLREEIVQWVLGNLMTKWGGIKRRHIALKANAADTLQNQFSGYGSTTAMVQRTLDRLSLKTPLESWDNETIEKVVNGFIDEKFPTVCALNKIDHADADKNIAKIAKKQPPDSIVLTSAISEVFLRKLAKQGYVRYTEGSEFVDTREDLISDGDPEGGGLKEMDEKLKARIENLKDMVLYRFGSTGVVQVLSRAAKLLGLVPVFPVRNMNSFTSGTGSSGGVFRDCVLVNKNTTVKDAAKKIMGDVPIAYIEGVGGVRVAETDMVEIGKNDILSFRVGRA